MPFALPMWFVMQTGPYCVCRGSTYGWKLLGYIREIDGERWPADSLCSVIRCHTAAEAGCRDVAQADLMPVCASHCKPPSGWVSLVWWDSRHPGALDLNGVAQFYSLKGDVCNF